MRVSIGPELTERQEIQREETENAAKVLRDNGFIVEVTYL